jgi:hypothetical protein
MSKRARNLNVGPGSEVETFDEASTMDAIVDNQRTELLGNSQEGLYPKDCTYCIDVTILPASIRHISSWVQIRIISAI